MILIVEDSLVIRKLIVEVLAEKIYLQWKQLMSNKL